MILEIIPDHILVNKLKELAKTKSIKQISEEINYSDVWTKKQLDKLGIKPAKHQRKSMTLAQREKEKQSKLLAQESTGIFEHDEYYKF